MLPHSEDIAYKPPCGEIAPASGADGADYDLERTPAETQHEFALRASRFLTGQPVQIQAVAEVPQKIVEAFYRVRFGHRDLDPDTLKELEENLDLLQTRLNTNPDQ